MASAKFIKRTIIGTLVPAVDRSSRFDPPLRIIAEENSIDTSKILRFRQGISVQLQDQKYSEALTPKISSGQQRGKQPDHYIEEREFGQPKYHLDDKKYLDINGRFDPIAFLGGNWAIQYPIVFHESLVDPARFDGVIEPLTIRNTIGNLSIDSPFHPHSFRGDLQAGNTSREFGSSVITGDITTLEAEVSDPFFDAQEKILEVAVPGYNSDVAKIQNAFNDHEGQVANDELNTSYDRNRQRYDHNTKSSVSGFIYGNNPEGTDSLAFGGLLKK